MSTTPIETLVSLPQGVTPAQARAAVSRLGETAQEARARREALACKQLGVTDDGQEYLELVTVHDLVRAMEAESLLSSDNEDS